MKLKNKREPTQMGAPSRPVAIRLLRPDDTPALVRLSRSAGWNQLPQDWVRLMELEPEGCFGIESGGEVVASATAVCFGRRLAWVGMVLTDPAFRRRGYARQLMEHTLSWIEQRGIAWIKLDATDMGRPLYEDLDFVAEAPIERWEGVVPERPARPSASCSYGPEQELDVAAFGVDRSQLLVHLAQCEAASIPGKGFAIGRPGADALSFGPCVSRDPDTARTLLNCFLGRHPGETVYWDLLPGNSDAVRLASENGFVRQRELVRMVRPGVADTAPVDSDVSLVYATAGFEYG